MQSRDAFGPWLVVWVLCGGFLLAMQACGGSSSSSSSSNNSDPGAQQQTTDYPSAEIAIGERLFLETRFSQFFAANMTGINQPLPMGDPVVAQVQTTSSPLPGPFAGQSINCRSCHFVTEFESVPGAGNRTYADFATRSPLPRLINGFDHTPRNSEVMVGSFQIPSPIFMHWDGEFVDPVALVESTMTGRNFGWSPDQQAQAIAHIAQVIRQDDGTSQLAMQRTGGLSYSTLFLGTVPGTPVQFDLPPIDLLNVQTATDQQVLDGVANLIVKYMMALNFKQSEGNYTGSPFDAFIAANNLPRTRLKNETPAAFNLRLLRAINALSNPILITGANQSFKYHSQPFVFGSTELAGLKIFLSSAPGAMDGSQHAGNCAACHQPVAFTDGAFHCTGVSQEEYDAANGSGAFMNLPVPSQAARNANYNQYLPITLIHPMASESFRHIAVQGQPQFADLGLWNVYLNPDMPSPQSALAKVVCSAGMNCSVDQGLANTIAQFKTPTLRDLEDSNPYFHNGSALTFQDVVNFYISSSQLARQGNLRNAPPEFQNMSISQSDMAALVAFLQSLTEDYDDNHLASQQ